MNTLECNAYAEQWRHIGRELLPPRAILRVSSHWYFGATAVTAMPRPRMIHEGPATSVPAGVPPDQTDI